MNTLTAEAIIGLPCGHPEDWNRRYPTMLNHWSCSDGCDWCDGTGVETFAVCVVDAEPCHTHWDDGDEQCCVCGARYEAKWGPGQFHAPVWLTELTEPCQSCRDDFGWSPGWRSTEAFAEAPERCPDCIDGRPVVEAIRVVDKSNGGGVAHETVERIPLGRGTVEHLLPVVHPGPCHPPTIPCVEWWVNFREGAIWMADDQEHGIPFDITVTPGQYVALVRLEEA